MGRVTFTNDSLALSIKKAIEQTMIEQAEPVIKQALLDVEKQLRQAVGKAAVDLASEVTFDRMGTHMLITVKDVRHA